MALPLLASAIVGQERNRTGQQTERPCRAERGERVQGDRLPAAGQPTKRQGHQETERLTDRRYQLLAGDTGKDREAGERDPPVQGQQINHQRRPGYQPREARLRKTGVALNLHRIELA